MINEELLKELYKDYEEIDNIPLKMLFREIMKLVDNYIDLKDKIDKAIEILHDDNYCHIEKLQKINEILGDKE